MLALVFLVAAAPLDAAQIVSEPFLGVRHIEQIESFPRPLYINVVEIDLDEPTLSFRTTPRGPSPQPVYGGIPQETIVQTTRQFLDSQQAQVAINASFFAQIHSGGWTNNLGLMASGGDAYSPWEPFSFSGDTTFNAALNITSTNQASIVRPPLPRPTGFETNPPGVPLYNTVTGSHRLIAGGVNVAPAPGSDSLTQIHPRTAVGITADNRLIMMTVDGRQPGFSEGVTLVELANLMAGHGAVDAINLDGGGSTTMAINYYGDTSPGGANYNARLLNSPVGNSNVVSSERTVGGSLGLFAAPNPEFQVHSPHPIPGHVAVLEDFESSSGRFTSGPTSSGSTFGVSGASRIDRVLNESYHGLGAQRLTVQSSNPPSPGLGLRHLSGGGSPGNNASLEATGYVGFYLKLLDTGLDTGDLTASIIIDDGPAAHERSIPIEIVADGNWHLYQWSLDDASGWTNFASGNGQIDAASITIDSIYLASSQNLDFNVFFDLLMHNPDGPLDFAPPSLAGDFNGDGNVDGADFVIWQTNFPTESGATLQSGDANGDGRVDGADFVVWQTNFPATSQNSGVPTPEPASLLLGLIAAALARAVRRRCCVPKSAFAT